MTDKYEDELQNLVINALEQKPLDFENTFNDLILDKIQNAVQERKIAIAKQMYNYDDLDTEEELELDDEAEVEETEEIE